MQRIDIEPSANRITVVVLDSDCFGGCVITADGREIPITDDMVERACQALEQDRFPFYHCRPRYTSH